MSTTALSMRGPRGINPKGGTLQQLIRENGYKLPEYLEMAEVNALMRRRPQPRQPLDCQIPRREIVEQETMVWQNQGNCDSIRGGRFSAASDALINLKSLYASIRY